MGIYRWQTKDMGIYRWQTKDMGIYRWQTEDMGIYDKQRIWVSIDDKQIKAVYAQPKQTNNTKSYRRAPLLLFPIIKSQWGRQHGEKKQTSYLNASMYFAFDWEQFFFDNNRNNIMIILIKYSSNFIQW